MSCNYFSRVTPSNNSTPILIYVEECPWYNNPLHVLRCDYTKDVSDCGHQYDAAVHCGKCIVVLSTLIYRSLSLIQSLHAYTQYHEV